MAIRYDSDLRAYLSRTVKNYNAKIRRLTEKGITNIPERISVKDLKTEYTDRRALKRELRYLNKFTERGSEEEIRVGEWTGSRYQYEREKLQVRLARNNLRRDIREAMKLEKSESGLTSDYLENAKYRLKLLQTPLRKTSAAQLKMRFKVISQDYDRTRRDETFYTNFFTLLFHGGYQAGMSDEFQQELYSLLSQLTPYQLAQAASTYGVIQNVLLQIDSPPSGNVMSYTDQGLIDIRNALTELKNRLPSIIKDYNR